MKNGSDLRDMIKRQHGPHKTLRAVNFICQAPDAGSVSVVGDFNLWNPEADPMQRQPDGAWIRTVELKHGHHRYAYLVDGDMTLDPNASGVTRNDEGQRVSLLPVS